MVDEGGFNSFGDSGYVSDPGRVDSARQHLLPFPLNNNVILILMAKIDICCRNELYFST